MPGITKVDPYVLKLSLRLLKVAKVPSQKPCNDK